MDLSQKLPILRKERHLTQQKLADQSDLTIASIGRYEANLREPSLEQTKKLADVLKIKPSVLFADDDDPELNTLGEIYSWIINCCHAGAFRLNISKGFMRVSLTYKVHRWLEYNTVKEPICTIYFKNNPAMQQWGHLFVETQSEEFAQLSPEEQEQKLKKLKTLELQILCFQNSQSEIVKKQ